MFLDFDGTLVVLAQTPDAIAIPPRLALRLASLSRRLGGRLALVSGRAIEDVERHLGPLSVACAGSHGAAIRDADGRMVGDAPQPLPRKIITAMSDFAAEHGADYEAKPHGGALHSRRAPDLEERCALFLDGLAEEHGLTVKRGKRVAELVRPGADKGAAVRTFMNSAPFAGAMPVFLGDDVTDEDGFAVADKLGGFGIAVGSRRSANARYGLTSPIEVRRWLSL